MPRLSASASDGRAPEQSVFTWAVPFILIVTAAALVLTPKTLPIPTPETVHVDPAAFAPRPMRDTMNDPASTRIGGFEQKCNACHRLFESRDPTPSELNQHTQLTHNHGINNRCYNCHDQNDREKLILRDGTLIGMSEAPVLCSQCHGPTYRDWEMGIHGKTIGSWDASSGQQIRLRCNACHDPHAPAFDQVEPLPGPRTLRMHPPDPNSHHVSVNPDSPLQRWLSAPDAGHDTSASDEHDAKQEDR